MSEAGNGTPVDEVAEQPEKGDAKDNKEKLVELLIWTYVMWCFLTRSTSLRARSTSDHCDLTFPTHRS